MHLFLFMQMSGILCKVMCKSKVPVFLFLDNVLFMVET